MNRASLPLSLLVIAAGLSAILAGCDPSGGKPRIGVALASVDDTFVGAARRSLEANAEGKAKISVLDGQSQQVVQNAQIDAMIADKAKAIVVNPVDSSALTALTFMAKAGNVPIVFFGRDPAAFAIQGWGKAYFVGADSAEAAELQVQILADYWKAHPEADQDKDGFLGYALLRGDKNLAAAEAADLRRDKAFAAAGIRAVSRAESIANWSRLDAQAAITAILQAPKAKRIEAVICANDEMAIGAIAALRLAGQMKGPDSYVPVLGIDATRFALEAIADGSLLGTVRGDADSQGKAAFDLAYALATGQDPLAAGWTITEGRYVIVPYQKVTRENYTSFQ